MCNVDGIICFFYAEVLRIGINSDAKTGQLLLLLTDLCLHQVLRVDSKANRSLGGDIQTVFVRNRIDHRSLSELHPSNLARRGSPLAVAG
jgi:hypothetical protein